ncbi:MAG: hypothetical protein RLO52_18265, partial [Sandaracinaceae bacterium]
ALSSLPGVVAASPAGARLRVVLSPRHTQEAQAALTQLGARLRRVRPDFEDLFLARIAPEAA